VILDSGRRVNSNCVHRPHRPSSSRASTSERRSPERSRSFAGELQSVREISRVVASSVRRMYDC
jgi:hypothetical protein